MLVLFFGRLRDVAGCSSRTIVEPVATLDELKTLLARENRELGAALGEACVRVAIDQAFASADARLSQASEVAFMPPLSGG